MDLLGKMLIGQKTVQGSQDAIHAINPSNNELLNPSYRGGTKEDVNDACQLAWEAFESYRETQPEPRAQFLETIAEKIEALGEVLIERAVLESGLPHARIEGERGRTCNQLRLFAKTIRDGEWIDARVDTALPDRKPVPRADLRQRHIPLGPVAVFGASNFPLAFSVAGGDTASALAAGCPVIVKAHSAHPGTSELVGRAIQAAVKSCGMHEGVFSLIFGSGIEVGQALVANPFIKAAGFTGSRSGGMALWRIAQSRPEPIPFYAEMSSINPVFLLPEALRARSGQLGEEFVSSLNMGAGQFCTNPGLVIAIKSSDLDNFVESASSLVKKSPSQTMLTPGIHEAYVDRVKELNSSGKAQEVACGQNGEGPNRCVTRLFRASAAEFLENQTLQDEVFGASSLVVECQDESELLSVAESLEGQLTATFQMEKADVKFAQALLPILERKAGRLLANGWPTGVEVCDSMVHGGPFPATSDSRTTSVGTAALYRFLRPVCYQNLLDELLPAAIKDGNPLSLKRLINGERE
jgi:2,5-dioxopentanoate dehydrogenase